jgi:hypothetical protein
MCESAFIYNQYNGLIQCLARTAEKDSGKDSGKNSRHGKHGFGQLTQLQSLVSAPCSCRT